MLQHVILVRFVHRHALTVALYAGAITKAEGRAKAALALPGASAAMAGESVRVTDIAGDSRGSVRAADFIDLVRGAYENRMAHVIWEPAP